MTNERTFGTHHDDVMRALELRGITRREPPNGGPHKTIEELIAGLDEGGIFWDYRDPGCRTLVNNVAVVTVLCKVEDVMFELFEDHRLIITPQSDLRYPRPRIFDGTIGEKMKGNDSALTTAMRGLREELNTNPELLKDHAFKKLIGAKRTETIDEKDPRAVKFMGDKRFADSRWHESFQTNPTVQCLGPQDSEFWSWLGFEDVYERSLFACEVKAELFDENKNGLTTVERKGPNKIVVTVFRWRNFKTKRLLIET
jgi:hypothetical protein